MARAVAVGAAWLVVGVVLTLPAARAVDIVTDVSALTVDEGGFGVVGVALSAKPAANVTVTVGRLDGAAEIYRSTVARFSTWRGGELVYWTDVGLYDDQTPLTVANFLNYVNDGDYAGTFLHRSIPGFVIQGGGFVLGNGVEEVPQDAPVANEPGRHNVRGTIAMAKLGGDPDSATNEWFFNLGDNTANLDFQNGGFTAFGEVVSGMENIDAIEALQTVNLGGAFTDLPVHDWNGADAINGNHLVWLDSLEAISGPEIVFTPDDWDQRRDVLFHCAPNDDAQAVVARFQLSAPGSAARIVTVTEADMAVGIVTDQPQVVVPEAGTAVLQVKLAGSPAVAVQLAASIVTGDADITITGGATLSFDTTNWNTYQPVTFSAAADGDVADGQVVVRLAGNAVHTRQLLADEADDDELGVQVGVETLTIAEGQFAGVQVRLDHPPLGDVWLSVTHAGGDASVTSLPAVRFDTSAGVFDVELLRVDTPQTVANFLTYVNEGAYLNAFIQRSVADFVIQAGGYRIGETSSVDNIPTHAPVVNEPGISNTRGTVAMAKVAGNPNSATSQWFVNTVDNSGALDLDNGGFTVFGRVVREGMTVVDGIAGLPIYDLESYLEGLTPETEFGGALETVPVFNLPAEGGDLQISDLVLMDVYEVPSAVLFTADNWDQYQELRIYADHDADTCPGTGTLSLFVAGSTAPPAQVTVNTTDIDALAVVCDTYAVTVAEGTDAVVGVALSHQPCADVTVSVALTSGASKLTTNPAALTFTPGTWNTFQNVTLSGTEDDDVVPASATLTLTAPDATPAEVVVTIPDDDTIALLWDPASLAVPEGASADLGVRLSHQPSGETVFAVTLAARASQLAVAAGDQLTFSPSDWSTPKTIRVTASEDDADLADEASAVDIVRTSGVDPYTGDAQVGLTVIDDDAVVTVQHSGEGATVPAGQLELFLDITDDLPYQIVAVPGLDYVLELWQTTAAVIDHPRNDVANIVSLPAGGTATVTAVFTFGVDGDLLPDSWEQQIVDADPADGITTVADVLEDDDFDRDGHSNYDEFLGLTDPTRYMIALAAGWNALGIGAEPIDSSVEAVFASPARNGGDTRVRLPIWAWWRTMYRVATEIRPFGGFWVFAPAPTEVEVMPGPNDPGEILHLERGWNFASIPRKPLDNSVTTLFRDHIAPPVLAWQNGHAVAVTELVPGQAYWIYALDAVDIEIPPLN